jgi:hypothetical protein
VIENPETGDKAELEGNRLWFKHSKAVVHALLDDQFEADESELDDAAAGVAGPDRANPRRERRW